MNTFIDINSEHKDVYNKLISHPLQSFEWGDFRKKTGIQVTRRGLFKDNKLVDGFTLTLHKIPKTPWNIGYLPKGKLPDQTLLNELTKIGKENNCIFIQLEPNEKVENLTLNFQLSPATPSEAGRAILNLKPAAHPLFTKYTFVLDLTKSEDELLSSFHHKARYNIKVAQKHGVTIEEDNSDEAFEEYLKLTEETTKRQKFFAHTQEYHRLMWNVLKTDTKYKIRDTNHLTAHLLTAKYSPPPNLTPRPTSQSPLRKTLVTWILLSFHDTLYYPYGASSLEYRETMASNLMMWEAITYGKKLGLKKFDMWGALGSNPDPKDPWYGFHRFKQGYGAELVEFVGSYDLVINPILYEGYKVIDKLRWMMLR